MIREVVWVKYSNNVVRFVLNEGFIYWYWIFNVVCVFKVGFFRNINFVYYGVNFSGSFLFWFVCFFSYNFGKVCFSFF